MSTFNPFVVEDVAANSAVSEFVNQARYSGGVAGLGEVAETLVFGDDEGLEIVGRTPKAKARDSVVDRILNWGKDPEVKTASLPGWAPVLALGVLGVLGVGGFFLYKAIKRR